MERYVPLCFKLFWYILGDMMKIGYARTSTLDQQAGFEAQLQELEDSGCEKIFKEQVSAVGIRPELDAALLYITLITTVLLLVCLTYLHLNEIGMN